MPDFLGYELIATVPPSTTRYTDDNNHQELASGATYCYRLVVVFPSPRYGESYMSTEQCATVEAVAPILTHVTINKTDVAEG